MNRFAYVCLSMCAGLLGCVTDTEDGGSSDGYLSLQVLGNLVVGAEVSVSAQFYVPGNGGRPQPPQVTSWSATGAVQLVSQTNYSARIKAQYAGEGQIFASNGADDASLTVMVTSAGITVVDRPSAAAPSAPSAQ